MNINVRVPLSLQNITGNKTDFECQGDTLEELLSNLKRLFPEIKEVLFDKEGKIKSSFCLIVNGKNVKLFNKEIIPLNIGDEVLIMQLVAGG
jgi:molybdopterin converting factor small subunit